MATYSPSKITKDGNTYNFTDSTKIPLAGTNALSGSIVPSTDNAYDFGDSSHNIKIVYAKEIRHGLNTGSLVLSGGNGTTNGASLVLYGTNRTDGFQGRFDLVAKGSSDYKLTGLPSGTLTWGSKNVAMQEDVIPRSGGAVLTGDTYARNVDNNSLNFNGGTAWDKGAQIQLFSSQWTGAEGEFFLYATLNANTRSVFRGTPNGSLTWNGNNVAMQEDVIPRSGGAVLTGTKLARISNDLDLDICGGTGYTQGSYVSVRGKNSPSGGGTATIGVDDGSQYKNMGFYPNGTWTWTGTACQITSDQRFKQQISEIDDKLLDAWDDVNLVQFKYNDAVDQKKDKARLHTGYVVQQIDSACKSHGVDISAYGLYCHEKYPQETEEVEVEQADGTKVKETRVIREASEHYSLRYTEVYAVECMYLRRCIARLTARIEELEKENNSK